MNKLKLHTPDITAANVERIAALFPNCVTEAADEKGNLKRAIDFDLLKQELSADLVEGPQERYRLDWPGKREALALANTPVALTLRPCREESVDFENTQNLYIEGDNLDALKLLQETYLGKVKMIYIDPPYNTGNDFIYEDDFTAEKEAYQRGAGVMDEEGNRMMDEERWRQNTTSNGRFHSDWLSMIYPRLKLARNLLSDDGLIFASIHDIEVHALKSVFNEVFGASNFVGQITWKARVKPVNIGEARYRPQREVEYVLVYQKSLTEGAFRPLYTGGVRSYPNKDGERDYRLTTILKSNRGTNYRESMSFPLGNYRPPEGQRWQAGEEEIHRLDHEGYIEFRDGTPFRRYYKDEEGDKHDPFYCFLDPEWSSTSEAGKHTLNELLGSNHEFDTVKPVRLLHTILQSNTDPASNHIILDFFSGSATTAHAVMQLNAEDGGKRRHIMVQLPEPCDEKSEAFKAGYETIAEIGKERIRRAGARLKDEIRRMKDEGREDELFDDNTPRKSKTSSFNIHPSYLKNPQGLDVGFRVLKIDSSNFADIQRVPDELDQKELALHTEHIKPERTAEDLLFQVLVDWGVDLSLPIRAERMKDELGSMKGENTEKEFTVFWVDENALAACFDSDLREETIKAIAARKPMRAVFRDEGYGDDSTRINVEQLFKLLSPGTELKSL
jgi:adenine-specific DNA-methyltransferase